ncbi:MAG: histidine triad nucleotide-binding protein [Desulfobacterium sp.]|jgi:histidine triad (HIT) family protein|nr:histidine triad nucleotide-binding protein [Desulfobacterium sp.]
MPDNCLFCKIVSRKIPSQFLYEDDAIVVFRDINPEAPVHLLIVPKQHIRSVNDLTVDDQAIVGKLFMVAKQMASEQGISKSGYRLLLNVERGGGQAIFHLHLHLIGGWKQ